jgi:hypothetical protein
MTLPERIALVLTPALGASIADSVARHLCAKHGMPEQGPLDGERLRELQETLRRGLVAFVGAERARALAAECVSQHVAAG